jgi:hypothetical protein
MAVASGIDGKVKIGANTVLSITEWSLDIKQSVQDKTAFGDTWEGKLKGLLGASGSLKGILDTGDTNGQYLMYNTTLLTTVTVTLLLYCTSTKYYTATAYLDGLKVSNKVDGKAEAEYSFVVDGAITLT